MQFLLLPMFSLTQSLLSEHELGRVKPVGVRLNSPSIGDEVPLPTFFNRSAFMAMEESGWGIMVIVRCDVHRVSSRTARTEVLPENTSTPDIYPRPYCKVYKDISEKHFNMFRNSPT